MPPVVLTTLKILFLALLYLFIARAVRIIYLDMVGVRAPRREARSQGRSWGNPKHLAITEPGGATRVVVLQDETTLGKEGATVPLHDTYASVKHARIWRGDEGWMIEDLGSTNGTLVNKAKVLAPQPLKVGDEIRIGKTTIEVRR